MDIKPSRPISIWITQILILIMGIPLTFLVLAMTVSDLMVVVRGQVNATLVLWLVALSILRLGILSIFYIGFWGLMRRRSYGRWLGVGIVALILLMSILGHFLRPSGPLEYYEYENSAQRVGGLIGSFLIYGLFGLLLYRLIFGENVADFFASREHDEAANPPPPPTAYFESESSTENKIAH